MKMILLLLLCLFSTACKEMAAKSEPEVACPAISYLPHHKISVGGLEEGVQYLIVVDDKFVFDECRRDFDQTYSVSYSGFSQGPKSILNLSGVWDFMSSETANVKAYKQSMGCDQGALVLDEDIPVKTTLHSYGDATCGGTAPHHSLEIFLESETL